MSFWLRLIVSNIGNTCFMNSSVQLLSVLSLHNTLLQHLMEHLDTDCFSCCFGLAITGSVTQLHLYIHRSADFMEGYQVGVQQDVPDTFTNFIQLLICSTTCSDCIVAWIITQCLSLLTCEQKVRNSLLQYVELAVLNKIQQLIFSPGLQLGRSRQQSWADYKHDTKLWKYVLLSY